MLTPTPSDIEPRLLSRIVVTWVELTLVSLGGGAIGTSVGGPPGLIIYFVTTLVSVGILFYNVNELIQQWIAYETSRT
ncbi:hypothetical protein DMJ13_21685 [halophilic archaeon]|nr:hypothetical protein DMJ13_21685 [halophilic archaeon]